MYWDFWNNPLVVSAFRVKYRSSGPWIGTVAWMLALVGIAYFTERQYADLAAAQAKFYRYDDWYRIFLAILFGGQALASAAVAYGATHSSMQTEVHTHTLVFQRLAALSPAGILQGKLLGETFSAFALMGGSLPLALLCMMKGVIDAPTLALMYVNIAATTLLAGSMGLLNRLQAVPGKTATGAGAVWIAMFFMGLPLLGMLGNLLRAGYVGQTISSALAPTATIAAIGRGEGAWAPQMSIFSGEIPSLLATPILQLLIASLPLLIMARRLRNPLDTGFTKIGFLARLLAFDVIVAAVMWPVYRLYGPLSPEGLAAFWLPHGAAIFLGAWATPGRALVDDWVWRHDGRAPGWRERVFGARAPTTWWAPLAALAGGLAFAALVLWPNRDDIAKTAAELGAWKIAACCLACWAYLALTQLVAALGTGPGISGVLAAAALGGITLGATLLGYRYGLPNLYALGLPAALVGSMPTDFMSSHQGSTLTLPAWPTCALHGGLAALVSTITPRYVRGVRRIVVAKLGKMGVAAAG